MLRVCDRLHDFISLASHRFKLMSKSWVVVGICGATNSGKTTLSSHLHKSFAGSIVLNQDRYFRPDDSKVHVLVPELNHKNWEALEAVNWEEMMKSVTKILSSEPEFDKALLIVEGHLIFNYSKLENIFHKKYFLTLTQGECHRRRITRVYEPPDVPGYFEKVVWPMYLSNLEKIRRNSCDIMYLDGEENIHYVQETVQRDLKTFILNSS